MQAYELLWDNWLSLYLVKSSECRLKWIQIIVNSTSYQLRYILYLFWYCHRNFVWWILQIIPLWLCPFRLPMDTFAFWSKVVLYVFPIKCYSISWCPYYLVSTQCYQRTICVFRVFLGVDGNFQGWTVTTEWIPASYVRSTIPFRPYASCSWSLSFALWCCRLRSCPFLHQIIWDYISGKHYSLQYCDFSIINIAKWA